MATYETFDDIYTVFMDSTRVDDFQLPATPEGKYALLEAGIENYLIYYDSYKDIVFDRVTESLISDSAIEFSDVQIIVAYMKLIIFEKIRDEFISTYDVLVDDIGIRNYKSQISAKEKAIEEQQKKIDKLIMKLSDDFDFED